MRFIKNMLVDDFINFLRCLDCKSDVERLNFNLHCTNCGIEYHIYDEICIDMLPSQKFIRSGKTEIEKRSIEIYNKLFDDHLYKSRNQNLGDLKPLKDICLNLININILWINFYLQRLKNL